jgi:hypothetical protein
MNDVNVRRCSRRFQVLYLNDSYKHPGLPGCTDDSQRISIVVCCGRIRNPTLHDDVEAV